MTSTTSSVGAKEPHSRGPAQAAGQSAPTLADAVLHELDERYDRAWWQEGWRRTAVLVAAVALAGVAAAGIAATAIARRRRFRLR